MPEPTDPAPASAPEPVKCPKCGSEQNPAMGPSILFRCLSMIPVGLTFEQSGLCKLREERDALRASVARLEGELAEAKEPALARNQSCGCVTCRCADEERCHGCGAKNCGTPECVFNPEGDRSRIAYLDAPNYAQLRSALAGSVPKAVALRACRIAADATMRVKDDSDFRGTSSLKRHIDAAFTGCYVETAELALARALSEEADRAASATQGDQAGTKGVTDAAH